jgi:polyferredoxin
VQQCGRWFCPTFCGVFSRKEITSFEDRERMVVELKSSFFKILYLWTAALDLNLLSFQDFLDLFSLSS